MCCGDSPSVAVCLLHCISVLCICASSLSFFKDLRMACRCRLADNSCTETSMCSGTRPELARWLLWRRHGRSGCPREYSHGIPASNGSIWPGQGGQGASGPLKISSPLQMVIHTELSSTLDRVPLAQEKNLYDVTCAWRVDCIMLASSAFLLQQSSRSTPSLTLTYMYTLM